MRRVFDLQAAEPVRPAFVDLTLHNDFDLPHLVFTPRTMTFALMLATKKAHVIYRG
jgi:hypothetical protein